MSTYNEPSYLRREVPPTTALPPTTYGITEPPKSESRKVVIQPIAALPQSEGPVVYKDPNDPTHYLIVDARGTLLEYDIDKYVRFVPEVIEISMILIRKDPASIEEQFHTFVRPEMNPVLTRRCTDLTGVQQHNVSSAPDFRLALVDIHQWLSANGFGTDGRNRYVAIVQRHFEYHPYVRQQCERMELGIPHWAKTPLIIQKEFFYEYNLGYGSEDSFTVQRMLDIAGLRYITRQSDKSQDQAFNVALITMHLMKKGHKFINPLAPPPSLLNSSASKELDQYHRAFSAKRTHSPTKKPFESNTRSYSATLKKSPKEYKGTAYAAMDIQATIPDPVYHSGMTADPEVIEISVYIVRGPDTPPAEERFHSYVKPKLKSYLTPACEEITGVKQFMVNQAPFFTEVVQQFDAWIERHGGAILPVVDGKYEFEKTMDSQVRISKIPMPTWALSTISLRREFAFANKMESAQDWYTKLDLPTMMSLAKLEMEGKPRSSRDHAFNMALLLQHLMKKGHQFTYNEPVKQA